MKLTDIFKCITEKRVKVITPDNKVKMRVTWEDIVDISWCIPEEISKEWLIEASKAFNDKDGRRLYDLLYSPCETLCVLLK